MSAISKQALVVDNSQSFPNNNAGAITPTALRNFNTNMIDSNVNQTEYNTNSGSWNVSISNLNTFTASQQPSFNALNSFTASQIITNTNLNAFTQSANAELDSLSAWTGSWEAWTSSINEIRDDGVLQGYSTRFFFNGLVSASVVQNVGGPIANVTIQQDGTKLNTSSFNDYTASTAATQSVFSASVATSISQSSNTFNAFSQSQNSFNLSATASITQLLGFSASLDATYATDAQLNASSSTLQANIDTKLNTSSFNQYTASTEASQSVFSSSIATDFSQSYAYINTYTSSTNGRLSNLELFSASQLLLNPTFATTGSNVFTGSQTITGSVYGNVVSMSIASQTASMDLSSGNFFTLELVSGSATHLTATNIRQGQTINLLVNQPSVGTGSLSYNSTFKFAPGNQYTASASTGSKDILTFITFDNSSIYASALKSLQ
tara:strand:- start:2890 stop:4200 length:1311 start_codon:yes stop_codon:yes gene_type:complete